MDIWVNILTLFTIMFMNKGNISFKLIKEHHLLINHFYFMLNFRSTPQEPFQNYFFALTRHIKTYPISDNTYDKITAIFLKSPDNHVVMKKKLSFE